MGVCSWRWGVEKGLSMVRKGVVLMCLASESSSDYPRTYLLTTVRLLAAGGKVRNAVRQRQRRASALARSLTPIICLLSRCLLLCRVADATQTLSPLCQPARRLHVRVEASTVKTTHELGEWRRGSRGSQHEIVEAYPSSPDTATDSAWDYFEPREPPARRLTTPASPLPPFTANPTTWTHTATYNLSSRHRNNRNRAKTRTQHIDCGPAAPLFCENPRQHLLY